jgi:hypothetical protein
MMVESDADQARSDLDELSRLGALTRLMCEQADSFVTCSLCLAKDETASCALKLWRCRWLDSETTPERREHVRHEQLILVPAGQHLALDAPLQRTEDCYVTEPVRTVVPRAAAG